jgi:hypothetical protein
VNPKDDCFSSIASGGRVLASTSSLQSWYTSINKSRNLDGHTWSSKFWRLVFVAIEKLPGHHYFILPPVHRCEIFSIKGILDNVAILNGVALRVRWPRRNELYLVNEPSHDVSTPWGTFISDYEILDGIANAERSRTYDAVVASNMTLTNLQPKTVKDSPTHNGRSSN